MITQSSTIRARLSSSALAIVFVCIVSGLYLANSALGSAEQKLARLDALESAARIESFLAIRREALLSFEALFQDSSQADDADELAALASRRQASLHPFTALWIADSAGVVLHASPADGSGGVAIGADLDTVSRMGIASAIVRARSSRDTELAPIGASGTDSVTAFAMVQPLTQRGQVRGFAVGTVSASALRDELLAGAPEERLRVVLGAGVDTVVTAVRATGRTTGAPTALRAAPVRTPGGDVWQVTVAHFSLRQFERLALTAAALVALAALFAGFVYERRQAERIAERSAELERLSAELLRANRAKSEFLANVSHELRTPLNAIVGFVELLRSGVYGELAARQVSPVERIEASANHLRHLVDQILDLAKMAAGRLEVHREPIDLRPFVFDVASEVEPLVNEKGLSFSLAVGATLPRVRSDPTHLRQILVNLIGNAVKFTDSGTVVVRARLVDVNGARPSTDGGDTQRLLRARPPRLDTPWIALQVVDTGIGIPEKDRDRIFEEFEQINAGPRGDSMRRGTGLGLSISRRLARLIGGDITVESEVGKGSVFTLWLPLDPADVRAQAPTPPSTPRVPAGGSAP